MLVSTTCRRIETSLPSRTGSIPVAANAELRIAASLAEGMVPVYSIPVEEALDLLTVEFKYAAVRS